MAYSFIIFLIHYLKTILVAVQSSNKKMESKSTLKLEIGSKYSVNVVIVNTPSNFFVQLISEVPKTGNMMNNLDNYYRNDLMDKELNKE